MTEYFTLLGSFRKYPYPPHAGYGGQRKQLIYYLLYKTPNTNKTCIYVYVYSEGVGGCLQSFFPEGLSSELFINNSFSVKQAISYFTVTGVSKQVLLFALIIFYLRSVKMLFSWLTRKFSLIQLSSAHEYRVARNFCVSLILRIDDFLYFTGTNFCDQNRLIFLAGNKFLRFSESPGQRIDNIH